jgi:hypothetical protein
VQMQVLTPVRLTTATPSGARRALFSFA